MRQIRLRQQSGSFPAWSIDFIELGCHETTFLKGCPSPGWIRLLRIRTKRDKAVRHCRRPGLFKYYTKLAVVFFFFSSHLLAVCPQRRRESPQRKKKTKSIDERPATGRPLRARASDEAARAPPPCRPNLPALPSIVLHHGPASANGTRPSPPVSIHRCYSPSHRNCPPDGFIRRIDISSKDSHLFLYPAMCVILLVVSLGGAIQSGMTKVRRWWPRVPERARPAGVTTELIQQQTARTMDTHSTAEF